MCKVSLFADALQLPMVFQKPAGLLNLALPSTRNNPISRPFQVLSECVLGRRLCTQKPQFPDISRVTQTGSWTGDLSCWFSTSSLPTIRSEQRSGHFRG
jgi:hypothetical protein